MAVGEADGLRRVLGDPDQRVGELGLGQAAHAHLAPPAWKTPLPAKLT